MFQTLNSTLHTRASFQILYAFFLPDNLEADVQATFDNGNNFNTKLHDTLVGLLNANKDRKNEIDQLRGDHEDLKKNFEDFQVGSGSQFNNFYGKLLNECVLKFAQLQGFLLS